MFDLPARPDDAEQLLALVSWAGATAGALGLDPFPHASLEAATVYRDRAMVSWVVGDPRRDGYRWDLDPYPITYLAAVDAGADLGGPLAEWVDAMRTLASGSSGGARRIAERTAEHAGPGALAQGRSLWDAAYSYARRLAGTTPIPAGPRVVPVWFNN
jgi:hypothetical protein